jgi:hypothetical protein
MIRVRQIDGRIVADNDPAQEAELLSAHVEQRKMWAEIGEQSRNQWQQHCNDVDGELQARLSPPSPRIEPSQPIGTPPVEQQAVQAKSEKKWTQEMLTELQTYRAGHTMKDTAKKFSISEQRIRKLLPKSKVKTSPFSGLGGSSV